MYASERLHPEHHHRSLLQYNIHDMPPNTNTYISLNARFSCATYISIYRYVSRHEMHSHTNTQVMFNFVW